MNDLARLLPAAGVFAFLALFLFGVRKLVWRQSAKLAASLDQYDYVILETHSLQLPHIRSNFERNGWRLRGSKQTVSGGVLSTFVRVSADSALLSEMLGVGKERSLLTGDKSDVDFQMKVKAHGFQSELNA